MKTILQIIPALGTGGAEQAVVDVAVALVARGDRAIAVSSGGWRVEKIEKAGATHILAQVQTKNPAKIIKNAFWLADIIRKEKVDIVHARSRAPAWSAMLACQMTGCHYVTTFHAAYSFSCRIKKSYNRVMAKGTRVIAISEYIARHLRDHYGVGADRLRLINRGIDLKDYDKKRISNARKDSLHDQWEINDKKPIVIFPSRLSPIKGHDLIIDMMVELRKQDVRLPVVYFVGDDQGRTEYSDALRERIAQEGLCTRIKLVGPCADMAAAYALADLVLVPSKKPEGFGRTPVEAMALGVPVIASAHGAVMDTVLDGETGWLVPYGDIKAWAEAMKKALALSDDERAKMAEISRKRVKGNFTLTQMIERTLAVYDEL